MKSISTTADDAWRNIADHYRQLASTRSGEGPGVQLACLVLADHCVALWSGDRGPSLSMIALAEHVIGTDVDEVVAAELESLGTADRELRS